MLYKGEIINQKNDDKTIVKVQGNNESPYKRQDTAVKADEKKEVKYDWINIQCGFRFPEHKK